MPRKRKRKYLVGPDDWRRRKRTGKPGVHLGRPRGKEPQIPQTVIADRDRRAALDHDPIANKLLGDPLPGQSALDQIETVDLRVPAEFVDLSGEFGVARYPIVAGKTFSDLERLGRPMTDAERQRRRRERLRREMIARDHD